MNVLIASRYLLIASLLSACGGGGGSGTEPVPTAQPSPPPTAQPSPTPAPQPSPTPEPDPQPPPPPVAEPQPEPEPPPSPEPSPPPEPDPAPPPPPEPEPVPEPLETFFIKSAASLGANQYCADPNMQTELTIALNTMLCAQVVDTSHITLDGISLDRMRLDEPGRIGSVVAASGSRTEGLTTLDLERVVVGRIEAVDVAHARIHVLRQRVYVTRATDINGGSELATLQVSDHVSVSGYFGPDGDVIATAIESDSGGDTFLLRGILEVGGVGGRLRVSGQAFADFLFNRYVGFPRVPAPGDAVLVSGNFGAAFPVAHRVLYIGGEWADGTEDARLLTGLISRRSHPSDLQIEGRDVDCTLYPCSELNITSTGALVGITRLGNVRQIETIEPTFNEFRVSGPVDAFDAANQAFTVLGFAVQVLPSTLGTGGDGLRADLAEILPGDGVSVRGDPIGDVIVAGRVDSHSGEPTISFQGGSRFVSVGDSVITVVGRTILTDETTEYETSTTCPFGPAPSISSPFTAVEITLSPSHSVLFAEHVKLTYRRRPCFF